MRNSAGIAWNIARRELRGGLSGFKVFLACLIIGVGAMATVGSLMESIRHGLARDARAILGGDVEISQNVRPLGPDALEFLAQFGDIAETVELKAMTAVGEQVALVELKGVSENYPLFGEVQLEPEKTLMAAMQAGGVVVEQGLLGQLGIIVGDAITVGKENVVIRAVLAHEPDHIATPLRLGPRMIMDKDALQSTGLLQAGGLVRYRYLIKFSGVTDVEQFRKTLAGAFPSATWQVRDYTEASTTVRRYLDNLSVFLSLTALTALLCGGIGVTNAVKGYLRKKTSTIAILKTMGASEMEIFLAYLMQISIIAVMGVILGVLLGAFVPMAALAIFSDKLPVLPEYSLYAAPLFSSLMFGVLVAVTFSLWQVGVAMRTPPAELFRRKVTGAGQPALWVQALSVVMGLFFCVLVMETSDKPAMARGFITGVVISIVVFYLCAEIVMWMASVIKVKTPWLRQGLSNIYRPSSMTHSVMMSMGIGLSVLVVVMVTEGNFVHQVKSRMPDEAPSFFLLDVQPKQYENLRLRLENLGIVKNMNFVPIVRGQIVKLNGKPVDVAAIDPEARWALDGDQGLTSAAARPEDAVVAKGKWWDENYNDRNKPLISLDIELAEGLGLKLGDTITFYVVGHEIEATVQNLRHVDYTNMQINFAMIISPGVIEKIQNTYVGTLKVSSEEAEGLVLRTLSDEFANVSAVRVRETLKTVSTVMEDVAAVVKAMAVVTVVAAVLVLAGALGAMEEKRTYETTVLKVLGARRRDVIKTFVAEFTALSIATTAVAYVIGTMGAYGVVSVFNFMQFTPRVEIALWTLFYASSAVVAVGVLSNVRAFSIRPAELLRNE